MEISPNVTITEIPADPQCAACGFFKHSHHLYSEICPVLVKGMLSQFQAVKEIDPTPEAEEWQRLK